MRNVVILGLSFFSLAAFSAPFQNRTSATSNRGKGTAIWSKIALDEEQPIFAYYRRKKSLKDPSKLYETTAKVFLNADGRCREKTEEKSLYLYGNSPNKTEQSVSDVEMERCFAFNLARTLQKEVGTCKQQTLYRAVDKNSVTLSEDCLCHQHIETFEQSKMGYLNPLMWFEGLPSDDLTVMRACNVEQVLTMYSDEPSMHDKINRAFNEALKNR